MKTTQPLAPAATPTAEYTSQNRVERQSWATSSMAPQSLQGDTFAWKKPPVVLVLPVLAAGGPLLWLPTAQAGWRNIPNPSQHEVFTEQMCHPVGTLFGRSSMSSLSPSPLLEREFGGTLGLFKPFSPFSIMLMSMELISQISNLAEINSWIRG